MTAIKARTMFVLSNSIRPNYCDQTLEFDFELTYVLKIALPTTHHVYISDQTIGLI